MSENIGSCPDRDRELDLRWWAAANYLTVAQMPEVRDWNWPA
jgi:hypothetical protein